MALDVYQLLAYVVPPSVIVASVLQFVRQSMREDAPRILTDLRTAEEAAEKLRRKQDALHLVLGTGRDMWESTENIVLKSPVTGASVGVARVPRYAKADAMTAPDITSVVAHRQDGSRQILHRS
jgi:hypothetical protein